MVTISYPSITVTDSEGDSQSASTTIGHDALGINSNYQETDELVRLLDKN